MAKAISQSGVKPQFSTTNGRLRLCQNVVLAVSRTEVADYIILRKSYKNTSVIFYATVQKEGNVFHACTLYADESYIRTET